MFPNKDAPVIILKALIKTFHGPDRGLSEIVISFLYKI